MVQQVKIIYKNSYDELEEAVNLFLKDVSADGATVDHLVLGNDSQKVAVVRYMKNIM